VLSIRTLPYTEEHIAAVKKFNERLALGGNDYRFPEVPSDLRESIIQRHRYIAVDEAGAVRGGYVLKLEGFNGRHGTGVVGNFQLPLSEGTVDPKYRMVGVQLLIDCLRRQPELYCLGIGGLGEPLALMLKHAGWRVQRVPFYFRILRPQSFLRNIEYLRSSRASKLALGAARITGIGYLTLRPWASTTSLIRDARIHRRQTTVRDIDHFENWADQIWEATSPTYDFVIRRDSAALQLLYPPQEQRFIRILIEKDNMAVGWAVLLATTMRGHKQFGNMRVGSVVDCFALNGFEADVIDHATRALEGRAVDLIVSNQANSGWAQGLTRAGYLEGPSNFLFASSKALTRHITSLQSCHLNRGDGDGPINL
jgi:hypothetical protein